VSVKGSPSTAWVKLLDDMLSQLLQLVVDSWATLNLPLKNNHEDTVTNALLFQLQFHRTARDLPFYILPQVVELNPANSADVGRLDIAFFPSSVVGSPSESIYFCLECKWLNVVKDGKKRPQGSKYVKQGMMRFVTGQYAKAVKHGGMVGYVLDGDIEGAIANVEDNIQRHCAILCMKDPGELLTSSILTYVPTARESFHNRQGETVPFRAHHLFFTASSLF
jgi:hypothetical protein